MKGAKALFSSERLDWLTPPYILDLVREVFHGTIDLDPCADRSNNTKAKKFILSGDFPDGLHADWEGTVFMNPPYGKYIRRWTEKWYREFENHHMVAGIALVAARTDTKWWRYLSRTADAICFVGPHLGPDEKCHRRLSFLIPGATTGTPSTFPSAVVFATNADEYSIGRFAMVFRSIGPVFVPASLVLR